MAALLGRCKPSHRGVLSRADSRGYRRSLRPCAARFALGWAAPNRPRWRLAGETDGAPHALQGDV